MLIELHHVCSATEEVQVVVTTTEEAAPQFDLSPELLEEAITEAGAWTCVNGTVTTTAVPCAN